MSDSSRERGRATVGDGGYVVRPGDCMQSIAYRHGFFWRTLWEHPGNARLRRSRSEPGVLLEGDRVSIPERRRREVSAATERKHRFVRKGVPAKLRLVVEHEDRPIANTAYRLEIGDEVHEGETDDRGLLEVSIPPDAASGTLEIDDVTYELQLGALDPRDEEVGVQERLANLGFYPGAIDGELGPVSEKAIAAFQARVGLDATGELDDRTRDRLFERHDLEHEPLPDEAEEPGG